MNNTCLTNPPGSSNAFIVKPSNVAKFAAQMFSQSCPSVAVALNKSIREKITKLEEADAQLQKKEEDCLSTGCEDGMMVFDMESFLR